MRVKFHVVVGIVSRKRADWRFMEIRYVLISLLKDTKEALLNLLN